MDFRILVLPWINKVMQRKKIVLNPKRKGLSKGYFQIYTGNGKGKTTAALGLALRATGHDFRIYIGQFMKGRVCGEIKTLKTVSLPITIEQYGRKRFIPATTPRNDDKTMVSKGLKKARQAMLSGEYDIVILDEIITAYSFELVTIEEMLEFVASKPPRVELIFTGRNAPSGLIERADLVTEMNEVKHYYQRGVTARPGIER